MLFLRKCYAGPFLAGRYADRMLRGQETDVSEGEITAKNAKIAKKMIKA